MGSSVSARCRSAGQRMAPRRPHCVRSRRAVLGQNWDAAVFKEFGITGDVRLDFRAENLQHPESSEFRTAGE